MDENEEEKLQKKSASLIEGLNRVVAFTVIG